jgi:NAD-dependent dihydropyrimidine dehydrogenase PreA subunit
MPLRDVITIDESLCDGCGDCVTSCAEGALRVIDGKARLVSEVYCDGLGACLGHCPQGAITVVRREAAPYDQAAVARRLERSATPALPMMRPSGLGCPGSEPRSLPVVTSAASSSEALHATTSQLRHWPVQLHLVSPIAAAFDGADVLLAADCVAFAHPSFHDTLLAGRSLAVACPKLDSHQDVYVEKLVAMIDRAGVRSLTVAVMEVPCCGGLIRLAQTAAERAARRPPMRAVVIGVNGEILGERSL